MTTRIRASSTDEAADCGRRHAAKAFRKEIEAAGFEIRRTKPSVGSLIGRAVHKAVELLLKAKRDGELLSRQDAVNAALPQFAQDMAEGAELDATTPNQEIAVRQIERPVFYYHAEVLPTVKPKLVEQQLLADIGDDFETGGTLDLLTEDGIIDDLKNEKATNASHVGQLGSYGLVARTHGHDVKVLRARRIKRQSEKAMREDEPVMDLIEYPIDVAERMAWNTIQQIKRNVIAFREDANHEVFTANPMSIMCGPKYCPAWGTTFCPEGTAAKPVKE